jgi:hypothetical protein
MNQQTKQTGPHRWQKGQSGNPQGRPLGSRQRIAERVLAGFSDLLDSDQAMASLKNLMLEDPAKFWSIAAGLLPRETLLQVSQALPGNLSAQEWSLLRDLLGVIEQAAPGADRERVFAALAGYLRSELATQLPTLEAPPIEPEPVVTILKSPFPLPE